MNIISIEYMIDIRLQPTECNLDIGCTYCMFIYVYIYIYIYVYLYTRIPVATLPDSSPPLALQGGSAYGPYE